MNILLTAVGSMSALCSINYLHKAGHKVIGCDIYPKEWHYESLLCDVFRQAPLARTKEYIHFLIQYAKEYDVKYILPLTDLEIDVINLNRDLFEQEGIILCMPSEEALSIARNKLNLYDKFKLDDKVLSIPTYTFNEINNVKFPCIAKPMGGRSSEGLYYLHEKKQLEIIQEASSYVFQEIINGKVCTVDYVYNPNDCTSFSISREELLRTKNGAGTTVRLFNDVQLKNIVNYIGKALKICGVVNMEFIRNEHGYYLIDINPRFSAGIAFSCMTGYDFINAHVACFSGHKIPDPIEYQESIRTKYFIEK